MKKLITLCLSVVLCGPILAQTGPMYAAAKAGLSIRETPDAKGKVLDKIPYGEKITVTQPDSAINISTEGFAGFWVKTTYKGKAGYVVNTYLFPAPPPKATTKTIEGYIAQISSPAGAAVTTKTKIAGLMGQNEDFETVLKKQLFKNGAEHHNYYSYEYGSDAYFLPGFSIAQGFQLIRLLKLYPDVIPDNEPFPRKDSKKTLKNGERRIKIETEDWGGEAPPVKKIKLEWEDGASYFLEIYQMDDQLVIYSGSGV